MIQGQPLPSITLAIFSAAIDPEWSLPILLTNSFEFTRLLSSSFQVRTNFVSSIFGFIILFFLSLTGYSLSEKTVKVKNYFHFFSLFFRVVSRWAARSYGRGPGAAALFVKDYLQALKPITNMKIRIARSIVLPSYDDSEKTFVRRQLFPSIVRRSHCHLVSAKMHHICPLD